MRPHRPPVIARGVPAWTASPSAFTHASGASSRSRRSKSPCLAAAMKASTTSQSASRSSACGLARPWPVPATRACGRPPGWCRAPPAIVGELEAEAVVQHEGDPLARRQPIEHHIQRQPDGVCQRDVLGRIVAGLGRLELVNRVPACANAAGPGTAGWSPWSARPAGLSISVVGRVQPQPRLLHDVLGLGVVAEHRLAIPTRRGRSASNCRCRIHGVPPAPRGVTRMTDREYRV